MTTLDNIQVGDKIAYSNQWYSTGWHEGYQIWQEAIVEKTTKTQLTVNGEVFLRRTGRKLGETHSYWRHNPQIKLWTEGIEKEIFDTYLAIEDYELRRTLLDKIDKVQFKYLQTDLLQKIADLL